jgi:hypothetical protein
MFFIENYKWVIILIKVDYCYGIITFDRSVKLL